MDPKRPKYMPDVQRVLHECEPEVLEARTREAIQGVYEAGLIDRMTPEPAKRPSAPSPWAHGGAPGTAGIDKEALPSAMMPAAEERPVTKAMTAARAWPATWKLVAAAGAVALAAPLLVVAAGERATKPERAAATTASATAAAPSTAAVPSVEAVVMGVATTAPSVSAAPSASAAVSPPPAKTRPKLGAEPRDAGAAPSPPTTAEPAPPPLPAPPPAPEPTSTPPQTQIKF